MKKLPTVHAPPPSFLLDLAKNIPPDAWLCWFDFRETRVQTDSNALAPPWTVKIESAILELLESDGKASELHGSHQRSTFFLAVDGRQLSGEPNLRSSGELKKNLTTLLQMIVEPREKAEGVLLVDRRAGQLDATLVRLDSGADAKLLVKAIRDGGKSLKEPKGSARLRAQQKIVEATAKFVASAPANYEQERHALDELFAAFRREIAAILEPAINAHVASMPQTTYEEKKDVAKWITAELRRFGLALKVDGIEHSCLIVANSGGRPGIGRYALYYVDSHGRRHDAYSPGALPHLTLALDEMTRSPYGQRPSVQR